MEGLKIPLMESLCFQAGIRGTATKPFSKNLGAAHIRTTKVMLPPKLSAWVRCTIKHHPLRCLNQEYFSTDHEDSVLMEKIEWGLNENEKGIFVNSGNVDDDENCEFCKGDEDDETTEQDGIIFDRKMFSSLLKKVSMADAKLYAKFAYLADLTYHIRKIQPENLLNYYPLKYVASSLDRKKHLKEQLAIIDKITVTPEFQEENASEEHKKFGEQLNQFVVSAATFFQSQTKGIIPSSSSSENDLIIDDEILNSLAPSFMAATTDAITDVDGAKNDVKQAIVDELHSLVSSPCEWFICDDDQNGARFFVIQGSESIASWQTNLFFEPAPFEGLDLPVHRGIYEAALCIYDQLLPDVREHMITHGDRATFHFTGHSLGGSLALLLSLMLLMRGEVPYSSLLPVIAFGAPYVLCGGDELLNKLGLPRNHYQSIAIHRDIVPRALSVYLSDSIVEFCKAINEKFRTHPCLINQRMLFCPMGELIILQPDENLSPPHHLLPPGIGMYHVTNAFPGNSNADKLVLSAKKAFLRSPYPTDILSVADSWGPEGTISKNHDMASYIEAIHAVIQQDLNNNVRKVKRGRMHKIYWPGLSSKGSNSSVNVGQSKAPSDSSTGAQKFSFSGILQTGRDTFRRFNCIVSSQNWHLLGTLSSFTFRR